jgi:RiboL-PSP-HEPN
MASENTPDDDAREEVKAYLMRHIGRVATNVARAKFLVEFVESFLSDKATFSRIRDDILRAAVVFLHATLEDFLRYIGSRYIPSGEEDALNKISLIGSSDSPRPEKFFLGKLAKHRGKMVDQLIHECVAAHLQKVSFNNTTDICQLLESAGIRSDKFKDSYPSLGELMARRHQIVHHADLLPSDEKFERDAAPIEASKVTEWYHTTMNFMSAVAAYKLEAEFGDRIWRERHESTSKNETPTQNDKAFAENMKTPGRTEPQS